MQHPLKKIIEDANVTDQKFGSATGCSPQELYQVMSGYRKSTPQPVLDFLEELGIDIEKYHQDQARFFEWRQAEHRKEIRVNLQMKRGQDR